MGRSRLFRSARRGPLFVYGLFELSIGLFLPPTFFMGGTLPLLLDGLVERDAAVGSRTSLLHGIDIAGAVADPARLDRPGMSG